ncbi:precorrin-6y C5,15-methyltransferase (decarboxylating) subunit CbiE, partial [Streptomyces sp. SID625]|nr:precorrin-6y C5,15-methyltransferase (decarboxylating) subunit CbiE [Streptomyces sp. SID625]
YTAERVGRGLTEHGYQVECALLQAVELDTRAWTETERSVAFLLSGVADHAP